MSENSEQSGASGNAGNSGDAGDSSEPRPQDLPGSNLTPGSEATPGSEVDRLIAVIGGMRDTQEHARRRFLLHGLIDQAIGILMARSHCTSAEAFTQLADVERRSGRSLLEIAADLVGETVPDDVAQEADDVRRRPAVLSLDRASGGADLARLLVNQALDWSGPSGAVVALIGEDEALDLVGSAGFPARAVSQWQRIPPALDCLLTRAVQTGAPVWIDASSQDVPPLLGEPARPAAPANGTRLAVPLHSDRTLIGAVEIAWPSGTGFDAGLRREITAVAQSVAPALFRALYTTALPAGPGSMADSSWQPVIEGVWEPALVLKVDRDPRGSLAGFRIACANAAASTLMGPGVEPAGVPLLEAAPWFAASGVFDTLRSAFESGVPFRDDAHHYVRLVKGVPQHRRIGLSAARLDDDHLLLTLRPAYGTDADADRWSRLARLGQIGSWEWDLTAGQAKWSREALMLVGSRASPEPMPLGAPPYVVHPDDASTAQRFDAALTIEGRAADANIRIVRDDGTISHLRIAGEPVSDGAGRIVSVVGTVQDLTEHRRVETALEIAQVQLAAQRTRVDAERQLAVLLQQIIMPAEAVRTPSESGIDVAARYQPASVSAGVGGDWYGILPLADGRVLMTIGDVAGHGLGAASVMAQLFHAWRGLAVTGAGPAELLGWLNTLTCELPSFTIASACCALYDPAGRQLIWANAGHPSPVLVGGGGSTTLEAPVGSILGAAPKGGYAESVTTVAPGDVVLFYTDGLVERRGQGHEVTTDHLLELAAEPEPDLAAYLDRILRGARSDTDDDTCLIAVRFR